MRYFKVIKNEYILTVGTGAGGIEITEDEYRELYNIFLNRPDDSVSVYDLRADTLTWEQTGIYTDIAEEISDAEALAIILGGETV